MGVILFSFLCILAAASATTDYRNETVKCVFRNYSLCYKNIEALGANFSVMYAETENQLINACSREEDAKTCISSIPKTCNALSSTEASNNVTLLIQNLCHNETQAQKFFDSSGCYNRYQTRREDCVSKYSKSNGTDAKTLCCSNVNIQKCLRKEMSVCSTNSTDFQNKLIETYRSPHNIICAPYTSLCNSASTLLVSAFVVLLAIKVVFVNAVL